MPIPSADHFRAIEHWFWRSTLSGYFGGWNTGQMAHDWREVREFSGGSTSIDVPAALPRDDIWMIAQFRANSAVSKMLALMLSYQDPVDLRTGQRIDARRSLAWNNDKEFHHFFPKDFLRSQGVSQGRVNAVANIVLLSSASNVKISNQAPSQYLRALIDSVGRDEVHRRLSTLLVSNAAFEAALVDDYGAFLSARSQTLHTVALRLVGEEPEDAVAEAAEVAGEVFVDDQVLADVE